MAFKNNEKYAKAPPPETQLSLVGDTFKRSFGRSTAHIAHIIPSFSVAMSDSKSTVSKTDSMCPLDMVEFPAGNQNSEILLAWGKLHHINSLKPPFEHVARAACFPTQSQALSLISNKTTVPADGLPSPKFKYLFFQMKNLASQVKRVRP